MLHPENSHVHVTFKVWRSFSCWNLIDRGVALQSVQLPVFLHHHHRAAQPPFSIETLFPPKDRTAVVLHRYNFHQQLHFALERACKPGDCSISKQPRRPKVWPIQSLCLHWWRRRRAECVLVLCQICRLRGAERRRPTFERSGRQRLCLSTGRHSSDSASSRHPNRVSLGSMRELVPGRDPREGPCGGLTLTLRLTSHHSRVDQIPGSLYCGVTAGAVVQTFSIESCPHWISIMIMTGNPRCEVWVSLSKSPMFYM